ncbi:MAG: hypothetical protein II109_06770 [Paludibacteraceae bacterium]|nr:hypothetical protein [Paludibacteraceae bacterium]
MIVTVIDKSAKHYEKKNGRFIYRYGYMPIQDDTEHVSAALEERYSRYSEPAIRQKVTEYCTMKGIANEYDPADYGY